MGTHTQSNRRRGHSVIEVTLMAPWIFFLFVGVFDFGFYAYAIISTENAARAAVLHNSLSKAAASDVAGACQIATSELKWALYGRTSPGCTGAPLQVSPTLVSGPDGNDAAQLTVEYTTLPMIPIPGVLNTNLLISRTVQMRVNPSADF